MATSSAPTPPAQKQDFIKGWPSTSYLERPELQNGLLESFTKALKDDPAGVLNYGTSDKGGFMLGHPGFLNALAGYLSGEYGRTVDASELFATGGGSMGTDICCRVHAAAGDYVICEAPTYYLAHTMFRERGLNLREVLMQPDGLDLDALEKMVTELEGKVKLVYTVPINHNPTGITMSKAKRERLVAMARKHKFYIIADEAYQHVTWKPHGFGPLCFEDEASDPRVLSVGTFSKMIGPGVKVGWVQGHPSLLKPLASIGFIDSGNNPVIFNSAGLAHFISSGALKEHTTFINADLSRKCALLVSELKKAGLEPNEPTGGYFVWCASKDGKITGRNGGGMCLDPPNRYAEHMRLCFAWLTDDQIIEGVRFLKEM